MKYLPSTFVSVEKQLILPTNLGLSLIPVVKHVKNYFNPTVDIDVFSFVTQDLVLHVRKLYLQSVFVANNQHNLAVAMSKNGAVRTSVRKNTKPAIIVAKRNVTKEIVLLVPRIYSLLVTVRPNVSLDLAVNLPGSVTNPVVDDFPAMFIFAKVFATNPKTVKVVPSKKTELVHVVKRNMSFLVNKNKSLPVEILVANF